MLYYFRNKFIRLSIFFDLTIIVCTLVLDWDPSRVLAFYWLDTCASIYFYLISARVFGYLSFPLVFLIAISIPIAFLQFYLEILADLGKFISSNGLANYEVIKLFEPFYESAFFLMLSGIGYFSFYRRLKIAKRNDHELNLESLIHTNGILHLLLIPFILIFMEIFFMLTINIKFSLIAGIIVARNLLEIWRSRRMKTLGV